MSSIRCGSIPMTYGLRNSSTAVTTAAARCVNVAQPQPYRPGSLVSTLTTTSCCRPCGAVLTTLTLVIWRATRSLSSRGRGAALELGDGVGSIEHADLEVVFLDLAGLK